MRNDFNLEETKKYYRSQTEICFKCDLFSDKHTHGSKVIMLFAEVFSFMVDVYGINKIASLITQYSNTTGFKKWFWKIKHVLGENIHKDPTFYDIGKWIGKGFFLKICISLIIYNGMMIEEVILKKMVERQKSLLKGLSKEKYFASGSVTLTEKDDHYTLLNEKIMLSYENEYFYLENLII